MRSQIGVCAIAGVALLALASCGGDDGRPSQETASASSTQSELGVHRAEELVAAAKDVVAFLQDGAHFERIHLADTVILYLAPEGGGDDARVAREKLADRANWRVAAGPRGIMYSFVPPVGLTTLTTRVGRHLNCREYALSSRFEQLARFPHVGIKLEPAEASSCLQSWNLTLVFDPVRRPPTIVAAVHDRWEW